MTLIIWPALPATIPTHFDQVGHPNAFGPKGLSLFAIPIFMAFLCLMALGAPRLWPDTFDDPDVELYGGFGIVVSEVILLGVQAYILHLTRSR
jgi:hypothetical protein